MDTRTDNNAVNSSESPTSTLNTSPESNARLSRVAADGRFDEDDNENDDASGEDYSTAVRMVKYHYVASPDCDSSSDSDEADETE